MMRLALVAGHKPGHEDLLALLEDPLSSETRATRRNLGLLTALAVLLGTAGRAPITFLGFGLDKLNGWEFPAVVAASVVYEFVAFRLYIGADVARKKIQLERAARDRNALHAELEKYRAAKATLLGFVSPEHTAIGRFSELEEMWRDEITAFDLEFSIQQRRRWWDVHMPTALFALSLIALSSMLRACVKSGCIVD
jgi:hypothetical protein